MYSFSPCKISDTNVGFERLKLSNHQMKKFNSIVGSKMSNKLQGYTYGNTSINNAKKVWNEIRALSRNQGLFEGVRFQY